VKKILVLATVVAVGLLFASTAFANSLACAHGSTCQSGKMGGDAGGSGTLPFTGLNLAGIAGVGGVLLLSGLTLHRVSRRRS
jgi:hypothetical protein